MARLQGADPGKQGLLGGLLKRFTYALTKRKVGRAKARPDRERAREAERRAASGLKPTHGSASTWELKLPPPKDESRLSCACSNEAVSTKDEAKQAERERYYKLEKVGRAKARPYTERAPEVRAVVCS